MWVVGPMDMFAPRDRLASYLYRSKGGPVSSSPARQIRGARALSRAVSSIETPAVTGAGAPLVGRSEESRLLRELLDEVRAGSSRFLFVSGEPGIGKTCL